MTILKPFTGLRPPKKYVAEIASRPYDVLNSAEARIEAEGKEKSLLHIIKPEIDLPPNVDLYDDSVYRKAEENFKRWVDNGWFQRDQNAGFYIYAQTLNNKTQYGLMGCAAVADYENKVIKKHELTRESKENDRIRHVFMTRANMEPVFFAYKSVEEIDEIIMNEVSSKEPENDFTADDGVRHRLWTIFDSNTVERLEQLFKEKVPNTYVADGHHRTAAAAKVGARMKAQNRLHSTSEDYNYFLAVHFPANQLTIIDYNRVVKDLNGLSSMDFIAKLAESFSIQLMGSDEFKPSQKNEIGMYLEGNWYKLSVYDDLANSKGPIQDLDVSILSDKVLDKILAIKNLRTSNRIDFVGGIRGLSELKRRVDSGEMKVAFALFPVSMDELIAIADAGEIMPPKTTWFVPKLRSGLVIHEL